MASKVKVWVPQNSGEVLVQAGGTAGVDKPITYKVSDHLISVDEADAPHVVAVVPGARRADDKPAAGAGDGSPQQ